MDPQPVRCVLSLRGRFYLVELGPLFVQAVLELQLQLQLPNGPVKAGRRWGQRHPQGANLGSNGILKFLSKTHTTAATSPP